VAPVKAELRKSAVLLLAGAALYGCAADPAWRQGAVNRCQAVGITEKDPQFATCTKALVQTEREDRIVKAYHDTSKVLYDPNKRHDELSIY